MKRPTSSRLLALVMLTCGAVGAGATTVIGDLNNFDTLNDTGVVCYGFEIEIDDIHSTDVTYTFDWNHYGAPKIREDNTDPLHPKVFVRYESTKDSGGNWGANGSFTNVAVPTITPPAGHSCTDPSVNEGCEHFGVGYYGVTTTIKYNWLVDASGSLVTFGTPVGVATPSWTYTPPAPLQPAQVVAAIPAPVVPIPVGKQFGEPSWVKVVKTTSHNANNVPLRNLISDDTDGDGLADWQNQEPDQVETEWFLLQTNNGANPAKAELQGGADDMGDGSETVTRRYEFYRYGAAADTLDGETGEAMCSDVNPTTDPNDPSFLHGLGNHVAVTDANGDTYYVDCTAQVVVGNYIGAQMAGFDAAAPLGLIDNLQDGEVDQPYTPRTVVVGGDSPYAITISQGSLPEGMTLGDYGDAKGVLSGTPTAGGLFSFTVEATDAANAAVSKQFTLNVVGPVVTTTTTTSEPTTTSTSTSTTSSSTSTTSSSTTSTSTSEPTTTSTTTSTTTTSQPPTTSSTTTTTTTSSTTSTTTLPPPTAYTLTVTHTGSGKVTSSPKGINCNKQCTASFAAATSVTLTASPAKKHAFLGWTGACSGTSPTCTVVMLGDRSAGAIFN